MKASQERSLSRLEHSICAAIGSWLNPRLELRTSCGRTASLATRRTSAGSTSQRFSVAGRRGSAAGGGSRATGQGTGPHPAANGQQLAPDTCHESSLALCWLAGNFPLRFNCQAAMHLLPSGGRLSGCQAACGSPAGQAEGAPHLGRPDEPFRSGGKGWQDNCSLASLLSDCKFTLKKEMHPCDFERSS